MPQKKCKLSVRMRDHIIQLRNQVLTYHEISEKVILVYLLYEVWLKSMRIQDQLKITPDVDVLGKFLIMRCVVQKQWKKS